MNKLGTELFEGEVQRTVAVLFHVESDIATEWLEKLSDEYILDHVVIVSGDLDDLFILNENWSHRFEVTAIGFAAEGYLSADALLSILESENIRIEHVVWLSKMEPPPGIRKLVKAAKSY